MMELAVKKTKAEETAEIIAEAVDAGKEMHLESVDFNDPNRPKTCLEVDFPILPINQIAQIEGNAGKPIYQMSKWWARRRSSVFRATLIAAATKAPQDQAEAAKTVWDAYYGNHQKNEAFKNLKVADIFMGGGTTLVEGARLGMKVSGNDLNPVAWLVVKNELTDVDIDEVKSLFDYIEKEVKSQIMPFYACEGPNGEKGVWKRKSTGDVMGNDFDPLKLTPEERKDFDYEGPEVIYTFWAKHGPCQAPECGHRTPLMSSPVIAVKTLSVKTWHEIRCSSCHESFDLEQQEARMAPDVSLVVAETEKPYAIMDNEGHYECPHCQHTNQDLAAAVKGESIQLPKKHKKNKKIDMTLLVHPDWLKGASGSDEHGLMGGTATSDVEATIRWNSNRSASLKLLEVRGQLPEVVILPDTGKTFSTSQGTIPKRATFTCQEETCGRQQDVMEAVRHSGATAPAAAYALQCYSKSRNKNGAAYGGRYFKAYEQKDAKRYDAIAKEWKQRSQGDLNKYWPKSELPYGLMTHIANGDLPKNYGYTHWYTMFNERQLMLHALILKALDDSYAFSDTAKEIVLGAFQQYIRNQNMFCFWDISRDCMAPMMSNSNYHPKVNVIENSVFSQLGRGNWASCRANTIKGLEWCKTPWETISNEMLSDISPELEKLVSGKSEKAYPDDPVLPGAEVNCASSTSLEIYDNNTFDLVITDPPFGGLLHYSELSDFFYVWLRLYLKDKYPKYFESEYTPKTLEAVANKARHPDDPDTFYKRLLTECWREAYRILKPGGILSFTFHHSEDAPWVDVLESLFDSDFYLEATYPIRSDETKGKGEFGSKTIEYDIIHVCRKRTEQPERISWARLRRQILSDVRQLQTIMEHHQNEGLPKADIQVIKRGKALEYFSRHYGQVYVGEELFSVKEALVAINQLLDDQNGSEGGGLPVNCDPMTRQFLRIFAGTTEIQRDQMQKYLRGTGMGPSDFINRNWSMEKKKVFHWVSPLEFAKERADKIKSLNRDLDQAMLLVGACYPNSGINVKNLLNKDFKPHPALGDLLSWLTSKGGSKEMRQAAATAKKLYSNWAHSNQSIVQKQLALFDLEDEE
jgi:putative DNA methylase